jgi:hypothetical protein
MQEGEGNCQRGPLAAVALLFESLLKDHVLEPKSHRIRGKLLGTKEKFLVGSHFVHSVPCGQPGTGRPFAQVWPPSPEEKCLKWVIQLN